MKPKYNIVGAIRSPLFKTGILLPMLTAEEDFYFELGAFGFYRLTRKQFHDSVAAGRMVRFDSPIEFPGSHDDAVCSNNDGSSPKYCLLYISEKLESDLSPTFDETIKQTLEYLSEGKQNQSGYIYYLLSDDKRQDGCKSIFVPYYELIRKNLVAAIVSRRYSPKDNLKTFLLHPNNVKLKDTLKEDCAALLGIASDQDDIQKVLPLFLLLDGQDDWTKEDWNGLYLWAEDYGKRAGIDFDARRWKEEEQNILAENSIREEIQREAHEMDFPCVQFNSKYSNKHGISVNN